MDRSRDFAAGSPADPFGFTRTRGSTASLGATAGAAARSSLAATLGSGDLDGHVLLKSGVRPGPGTAVHVGDTLSNSLSRFMAAPRPRPGPAAAAERGDETRAAPLFTRDRRAELAATRVRVSEGAPDFMLTTASVRGPPLPPRERYKTAGERLRAGAVSDSAPSWFHHDVSTATLRTRDSERAALSPEERRRRRQPKFAKDGMVILMDSEAVARPARLPAALSPVKSFRVEQFGAETGLDHRELATGHPEVLSRTRAAVLSSTLAPDATVDLRAKAHERPPHMRWNHSQVLLGSERKDARSSARERSATSLPTVAFADLLAPSYASEAVRRAQTRKPDGTD